MHSFSDTKSVAGTRTLFDDGFGNEIVEIAPVGALLRFIVSAMEEPSTAFDDYVYN